MKWLVPKCPLFRGSTVHKEEDNLSIVDEMTGPKVSFIQRFHRILWLATLMKRKLRTYNGYGVT